MTHSHDFHQSAKVSKNDLQRTKPFPLHISSFSFVLFYYLIQYATFFANFVQRCKLYLPLHCVENGKETALPCHHPTSFLFFWSRMADFFIFYFFIFCADRVLIHKEMCVYRSHSWIFAGFACIASGNSKVVK